MRHRGGKGFQQNDDSLVQDNYDQSKSKKKTTVLLSESVWFVLVAFHFVIFFIIHQQHFNLPKPKTLATAKPGEFVEERARKYLDDLTSFGTRPVGSVANEKLAVNYILEAVNKIKAKAKPIYDVEVDLQEVSGSFSLNFLGGFVSNYDNVQNVVVKLAPSGGAKHSLLVSCHFDSVLDSPGK